MRLSAALSRCAAAVRRTAGRLARAAIGLVRRVVVDVRQVARTTAQISRRWARLGAPLLAAACSRAESNPAPVSSGVEIAATASTPVPAPPAAAVPAPEPSLGEYQLTFYFVTHEEEVKAPAPANDNKTATDDTTLAATTLPDLVPIYDRSCKSLTNVSRAFAAQLAMQGTGRLRDGRVLNVAGKCDCPRKPCFHVLPDRHKWGMGGSGMPLEPFRSVAVDPRRIKLGSLLYLPELDGVRMPGPVGVGGFIHDGCVVAADTGGGIKGKQLDLFVARRAYYRGLARRGGSHGWARTTPVFDGTARCKRTGGKVSRSAAGSI